MRAALGLPDDPASISAAQASDGQGGFADAESLGIVVTSAERTKIRRDNQTGDAAAAAFDEVARRPGVGRLKWVYDNALPAMTVTPQTARTLTDAYAKGGLGALKAKGAGVGAARAAAAREQPAIDELKRIIGEADTPADTYGGFYLDRATGQVVVMLTKVDAKSQAPFVAAFPYPDRLEFREATASAFDLQMAADRIGLARGDLEARTGVRIGSVRVDTAANRVVVEYLNGSPTMIDGLRVALDAKVPVDLQPGSPPGPKYDAVWDQRCSQIQADMGNDWNCNRDVTALTLRAGVVLAHIGTNGRTVCTSSWMAQDPSTAIVYIMSAGHCTGGSAGVGLGWWQGFYPAAGAGQIWVGNTQWSTDGGTKDAMFVPVGSRGWAARLYKADNDNYVRVDSLRTDGGYVGQTTCFSGPRNGGANCGVVRSTSLSPSQGGGPDGSYKATFVCAAGGVNGGPGESGGPFYNQSGAAATALGIMNGPQSCGILDDGLYYTKLSYALNGFSLLTS